MSAVSSLLFSLGCVLFTVNSDVANAFAVLPPSSSPSRVLLAASPLADDALGCYPYEFRPEESTDEKRSLMDIPKSQALTAFNELARLYGEQLALDMVKIEPLALATDSTNFEPALEIWSETFGSEAAQSMVARNPGLLFIKAQNAETDAFGAMGWSYVIWATRPIISKLLLAGYVLYQYNAVATSEEGLPSWILHASDGLNS